MLLLSLLFISLAHADLSVTVKNKTTLEFNIDTEIKSYIAHEITISAKTLILEDYKFFIGSKYKTSDYIKLDPHWFIQTQRKNDWIFEYGPALRIDFKF